MKENKNYRFFKTISIAGVQFLEDKWRVMATINVGDLLTLVREPDNDYDANAIRIDAMFEQKIGYMPRTENTEIAEKIDVPLLSMQ